MPLLKVDAVGDIGLVTDRPGHDLPPNAWTVLSNVRAVNGYIERVKGEEVNPAGAPTGSDFGYIAPAVSNNGISWLYASGAKVQAFSGTSHADITRISGDYTATVGIDPMTSWWLNGIFVFNNGRDAPQLWNPVSLGTPLVDLPNWPAGYTAKFLRGYKNYLVAGDVDDGVNRFPTRLMWSAAADAGSVPGTWSPLVTTERAGDAPLSETPGRLIDSLPQRDTNVVYKEDATYLMQWIGGNEVFRLIPIDLASGAMAANCMAQYAGGNHIVLNQYADIMEVNGTTVRSLIDNKVRRLIQGELNGTYRNRCFSVLNQEKDEIWVCYPSGASEYCDRVVILNYKSGAVTVRDLTETRHIALGPYDPAASANTWDSVTGSWDDQFGGWSALNYDQGSRKLLGVQASDIALLESTGTFGDGSVYSAKMVRNHLPFMSGKVLASGRKQINRVRPIIESSVDVEFKIRVGSQETREGPIFWQGPISFFASQDEWVDFLLDGKFMSIEFVTESSASWKFHGYEIEWEMTGD